MQHSFPATGILLAATLLSGCAQLGQLAWSAADQAGRYSARPHAVPEIEAPPGYRVVRVVQGLNFPSSMAWDEAGNLYVLESHTVPVQWLSPRIVKIDRNGRISRVRTENLDGDTAIGLTFHDGFLYFSHEEKDATFSISRVPPAGGTIERIIRNLPAQGDHDVNYLVFDRAGNLYFGLGSATNSGVVSSADPVNQKWLKKHPRARDISCRDLVLTGESFSEDNGMTETKGDLAQTGAFQSYGSAGATRIAGEALCTSAIYKVPATSRSPEVMAWGFRNPVALALDSAGRLYTAMHGADIRSSRPILDDPDAIYRVEAGRWYGWPDYSASLEPVTGAKYQAPAEFLPSGKSRTTLVIDRERSSLPVPDRSLLVSALEPHSAVGGMTFVPSSGPFSRWAGQLLVSEMGDFKPLTDKVKKNERAGFQVEAINMSDGTRRIFLRNRGTGESEPASTLDLEDGIERPVDVKIGPDGLVYVLDFGAFITLGGEAKAFPKTGKVFRIEPDSSK